MPTATGRDRFLAAFSGHATGAGRPVWLMRQAGRFLPEYRAIRAIHPFLDVVHSPSLCTEVALQPLRRFDLDATIVFSDILVIPDELGMGLSFATGEGPSLSRPLRSEADENALNWAGLERRLDFVYDAVRALRVAAPDHALVGFAGAPWTLYCYMVDGEGGDFAHAMASVESNPDRAARILTKLADAVADHLIAQAAAGADVVQVFDTWAGRLDAARYMAMVAPGLRHIAQRLHAAGVPGILFLRGAGDRVSALEGAGFPAISVDATTSLVAVREALPGLVTQGNLAPEILLQGDEIIQAGVNAIHDAVRGAPNHIYNLGHGLLPQTPPEAVGAFVRAVRNLP